jgi:hypothetical protein
MAAILLRLCYRALATVLKVPKDSPHRAHDRYRGGRDKTILNGHRANFIVQQFPRFWH